MILLKSMHILPSFPSHTTESVNENTTLLFMLSVFSQTAARQIWVIQKHSPENYTLLDAEMFICSIFFVQLDVT